MQLRREGVVIILDTDQLILNLQIQQLKEIGISLYPVIIALFMHKILVN